MSRTRSADDFEIINRRQREIAAEHDLAIAGEAPPCDCPTERGVDGVYQKAHAPGCPVGTALHYGAMLRELAARETSA